MKLRFSNKSTGSARPHQIVAGKPGNFTPREHVSVSEQVSKLVASDVKKILEDRGRQSE